MAELQDEPTTLMFHAEMTPPVLPSEKRDPPTDSSDSPDPNSYSTFLASRSSQWEFSAICSILASSHLAGSLHIHIVHLSAAEVVPLLRRARECGVNITAETCFHYLALAAEEVPDGDTRYKCCPPIREQANREDLWKEVLAEPEENSVIKTVVSDHSPCTPDLKLLAPKDADPSRTSPHSKGVANASSHADSDNQSQIPGQSCYTNQRKTGSFVNAWGGVSSLGLGLPILWPELDQRLAASSSTSESLQSRISRIRTLCSLNTARQVGLQHQKATLAAGYDADICVFDPDTVWKLTGERLLFKNKVTPYEGRDFKGMVMQAWVRGRKVFQQQPKSASGTEASTSDTSGLIGSPIGRLLVEKRTS